MWFQEFEENGLQLILQPLAFTFQTMPLTKHDLGSLVCIVINLRGWTTEEW